MNTSWFSYIIFTLISVYFFVADILYFRYALNGIWASKILFLVWLFITIVFIIRNWKSKKAKFSLFVLISLPLFLLFISGILLFDILRGITDNNSAKRIDVKNYSIYANRSVLSGDFIVLYKNLYLLKEMKSSKKDNYDE